MVQNPKPPLDLGTASLSKLGDKHLISDARGNRFALTPISDKLPLSEAIRDASKRAKMEERLEKTQRKLEDAKAALEKTNASYDRVEKTMDRTGKKTFAKWVFDDVGKTVDGMFKENIAMALAAIVVALPVAIVSAIGVAALSLTATGIMECAHHLIDGPIRALHTMPKKHKVRALEKAVERKRARLEQD